MTDKDDPREPKTENAAPESATPEPENMEAVQESVRSILRRAKIRRVPEVDLLTGVQRRIRERSRGRFYADGWSRRASPTSTYVVTSLLMLVILSLVYFVLLPSIN
jgi:hypothetical protein